LNIESFRLEGTTPVWRFATGDALLEKRIWMQQGENTTFVQYSLVRANSPLHLACKALVNYRNYHATTHAGNWQMHVENIEHGIKVTAFDGAAPFYLFSRDASVEPRHEWHRDCFLPLEQYRGLDTSEDHLLAGIFHLDLRPGQSATIVPSTIPNAELDGIKSLAECDKLADSILANWDEANKRLASSTPGWIQQLVLNAN